MSKETPNVEITSDTGASNQWGLNLLFFRDGNKWTLKVKLLFGGIAIGLSALSSFQLILNDSTGSITADSPITLPTAVSSQSKIDLQTAAEEGAAKPKKQGAFSFKYSAPQLLARPMDLKKIPPGSMLKARLMTGASNGLVRAEVKEGLIVNGDTFIEEGSTLLGNGSSTEDRLYVTFQNVVFKDGTFGQIQAQACDKSDQIVGLKGSKIGNKALNIAGSIGLGFVGGFSEGMQDTRGEQGTTVRPPSVKNALLNATATTALEQSKNLMSELKNRQPVIEVPVNTEICVIFGGAQ